MKLFYLFEINVYIFCLRFVKGENYISKYEYKLILDGTKLFIPRRKCYFHLLQCNYLYGAKEVSRVNRCKSSALDTTHITFPIKTGACVRPFSSPSKNVILTLLLHNLVINTQPLVSNPKVQNLVVSDATCSRFESDYKLNTLLHTPITYARLLEYFKQDHVT